MSSEFWQLLVYCSEQARGSRTGVVFPSRDLSPDRYQPTAAALGYPDTVFLEPGAIDVEWRARSFSLSQELSLCTQALIAAFRVLQEKNGRGLTSVRFQTPSGPITVGELGSDLPGVAWLTAPFRILDRTASKSPISDRDAHAHPDLLIDTGRTRVFRELTSIEELSLVRLEPEQVIAYCESEGIHGICLFARSAERQLRMRVFTTSQDGGEDISTGGAAMGLLPYLATAGGKVSGDHWTVRQGFGPAHLQGVLFTTSVPGSSQCTVGGRHRFVARGTLL